MLSPSISRRPLRNFLTALPALVLLSGTTSLAMAQNIGKVEIRAVSPRDVSNNNGGIFDEVSSGLNVVGAQEKVYLEAAARRGQVITGATWELTGRPSGSNAALSDTTGTLVTIVPDVAGLYLIRMTPLDPAGMPADPVEQRVYAGVWVGAGVFNPENPFDAAIPSCANACCHSDSTDPRLNVVDNWIGTTHANKLQLHLEGMRGAEYDVSCLPCHTLGFKETASNLGFDDRAAAIGYDMQNIVALIHDAATNGVDNWNQLPAELKRHASIQCESCHGPGSQHLGFLLDDDKGIAGVDLSTKQCAQCHDTDLVFGDRFYQWNISSHPVTADASQGSVAGNNTCRVCHTGEGFVYGLVKGQPIPQLAQEDYHGITCSSCHDPHGSEYPSQLRIAGDTTFPSGVTYVNAGSGGICMNCHHSRSANPESTALTSFRGAHYGTQGEMLANTGMVGFGLPVIGPSAHTTIVEDTCVACHMAESDNPLVGGHTYAMRAIVDPNDRSKDIINANNACGTCHSDSTETYDRLARGDYDGNGVREGIQTEIRGLLALLRPGILAFPGTSLSYDGLTISIASSSFGSLSQEQKRAFYNYNFVVKDGSFGIHNTSYAVQMLHRAYYGAYGRSILDDYPRIDLRGPVQPMEVVTPPTPTPTPIPTVTPAPTPVPRYLAEVELLNVSPRDLALDQTGRFDELASGLRAVGIGEKVFMEAVQKEEGVVGYTWSIIGRPAGSMAQLDETTGDMVTFRPDRKGTYIVRLTPQTSGRQVIDVFDQRIYAAEWVGVGVFDSASTPRAPQCGTGFCHGGNSGNPDLNVLEDWLKSDHATILQSYMNGDLGPDYDLDWLIYHTLGYNAHPDAVNLGFDDLAQQLGFNVNNIPALVADAVANDRNNFTVMPGALRNHSSVQCESCHGAGSQHPPNLGLFDKGIDGANLTSKQCAQCHDATPEIGQQYHQWYTSAHPTANTVSATVATNNTCRACHTGEGFIAIHDKGTAIPQLETAQYHGVTCVTCHDPHSSDEEHQLRVARDFRIPSGSQPYGSGTGGLCFRCHNSRIADPEATALTSFRGAHYGPQGDMIIGSGGVSFGLGFNQDFTHSVVVENSCVHCHMAKPGGEHGDYDAPLMGDHSFTMRTMVEGEGGQMTEIINATNACATCHIGLDIYDRRAGGDYDGNGIVEGVQTEVDGLFALLRPGILEIPGTSLSSSGYISMTTAGFNAMSENQKRAVYNFNFVWRDGSRGVHNTSYAVQLLQRSYYGIYGRPIQQDYPNVELRGPVQDVVATSLDGWVIR